MLVTEGLTDMVRERVIDAHTLRVRDKVLVRVPLAQRVLVTVVEPLLEGLREMVRDTLYVTVRVLEEEALEDKVN